MPKNVDEFKKKFRALLGLAGEKRISRKEVPKHFRRLDSIARLLEGGSICAAVYFHAPTKTIWIANNKIHASSREDNQEIKRIREIFGLISHRGSNIEKIIECLSDVIYWHISQEKRYEKAKLDEVNIKEKISKWMEELFLSGKKCMDWKKRMVEEEDDKNIIFVIQKTAKIVRDFIKVRSFLLENPYNNETASGMLSAINAGQFNIVHMEAKDVHAEMRLLAKKIATEDAGQAGEPTYFGISKLCCNHCALAMKSFNVQTRGVHGQGANWGLPRFISENSTHIKTFFGQNVHGFWQILSTSEKTEAKNFVESKESSPTKGNAKTGRGMYADSSSSDLEFGVQLDGMSEEEQLKDFTLQQVWQLKEIKQLYRNKYDWLREIGYDLAEIVRLYREAWPKFNDLTAKRVREFIADCKDCDSDLDLPSEKEMFDTLSELYTSHPGNFERVISTPEHLIKYHGFHELIDRLSSTTSDEGSSKYQEGYSHDEYSSLEKDYQDDHGWEYKFNSEDSQNLTYGSSSDTEADSFDNAESSEEELETSSSSRISFG